jgi:hypothetical protein
MEALKARDDVSSWNDDRLDELARDVKAGFEKVDARFDKVDARFAKVEGEMKEGFETVDQKIDAGFASVGEKFERLYRLLLVSAVSVIVSLLGGIAALIATHA